MSDIILYGTVLSGHTQRVAALLSIYPYIRAWIDRLEALPAFVPLPPAVR